uniref:DUF4806 domain-containing protein n=1 Tax=Angiostrongylus cantonensis TaxID=6313 RepID=A0A0K0DPK6_ANGCA
LRKAKWPKRQPLNKDNSNKMDICTNLVSIKKGQLVRKYIYPLWMCPYNQPSCPGIFRQRSGRNMLFVSVGVHGSVRRDRFDLKDSIKRLEEFVISVKGVKMIHGDMRMSRAEFWQMFDSSLYEWIRVKYNCREAFLDVYDKICMSING